MEFKAGLIRDLDMPKRKRNVVPKLLQTPVWQQALAKLAVGLKPQEGFVMKFSAEDLRKLDIKGDFRVSARAVREYLKKSGLPYQMLALNTSDGGGVISIANEQVIGDIA